MGSVLALDDGANHFCRVLPWVMSVLDLVCLGEALIWRTFPWLLGTLTLSLVGGVNHFWWLYLDDGVSSILRALPSLRALVAIGKLFPVCGNL